MPATPARIAFITRQYRLAIAGPDSGVDAHYGDLARDINNDEPIETFFDSTDDADAAAAERLALMKENRTRHQAVLPGGIQFGSALDYSQSTPTGTVVDPDRDTNKPALVSEISLDLRNDAAGLVMWG